MGSKKTESEIKKLNCLFLGKMCIKDLATLEDSLAALRVHIVYMRYDNECLKRELADERRR